MCILLVTTAHPDYPLIILSNRDEFLHRPTARAAFWESPNSHIFSGRDLARPERGTWLGVTRTGHLAILTNFRESSSAAAFGEKSRGAMVTSFLTSFFPASTPTTTPASPKPSEPSTKDWLHSLLSSGELTGVGGFSLLCGILRPKKTDDQGSGIEELAVISNRTAAREEGVETGAHWIAGTKGETHGLSNSLFDNPWPKVKLGRELLSDAIQTAVNEGVKEDELVKRLLAVLSHDTLPVVKGKASYDAQLEALRHSIFVPAFSAATEHPPEEPEVGTPPPDAFPEGDGTPLPKEDAREELMYTNGVNGTTNEVADGMTPTETHWWRDREYGTQKQTVLLVDKDGRVKYIERTLYDENGLPVKEEERDTVEEFVIEGWRE